MDKKRRANRNNKIKVTDDISHTGLTEEEYKLLEESIEEQEDKNLSDRYQERLDTKEDEWIQLPPGKSIFDYYKEQKKKREE